MLKHLSAFPEMMSRKIDKINNLAGLPGDGGEVLVGGKCGILQQKMREFAGKWEFYGEMGGKVGIETWSSCWPATGTVRVTILTSFSRFN